MGCGHESETEWWVDHNGCCDRGRFVACGRSCLAPHMAATGDCGASRVVTMPQDELDAYIKALRDAGEHV